MVSATRRRSAGVRRNRRMRRAGNAAPLGSGRTMHRTLGGGGRTICPVGPPDAGDA